LSKCINKLLSSITALFGSTRVSKDFPVWFGTNSPWAELVPTFYMPEEHCYIEGKKYVKGTTIEEGTYSQFKRAVMRTVSSVATFTGTAIWSGIWGSDTIALAESGTHSVPAGAFTGVTEREAVYFQPVDVD
jgi:hypothetical protein